MYFHKADVFHENRGMDDLYLKFLIDYIAFIALRNNFRGRRSSDRILLPGSKRSLNLSDLLCYSASDFDNNIPDNRSA